ncbi:MAG TPA: DHA2 family efflux MFS transporter permease subunit, partial [Acidimicrobiales bacterium]|nr:DHA2 family efflux MFS transporter permease subunit [Acidimicrobiales bacterium]
KRYGTKRPFIISIVAFTLGSLLCGLAWSAPSLIVFRIIQGLGGGLLLPVGATALARAAGPLRMGRAMSLVSIPVILAPTIGPTIGGLVLVHLGWRWIFFINLPVGIITVIAAWRLLADDRGDEPGRQLDVVGFVLLGVGIPAIIYGLAQTVSGSLPEIVIPLVVGILLVVAFVFHAGKVPRPLLDLRLYRNGAFSAASVATFCLGAAMFGGMILLPLYYQTVRGESPVTTGLLLIPQGVGVMAGMLLAGWLTDRFGGGPVAFFGVLLTCAATAPLALVGGHTPYTWLDAVLFIRGFGMAAAGMPAMAAAFAALRHDQIDDASPQLNVLQRVGGSLGTAIIVVILQHELVSTARAAHGHPTSNDLAQAFGYAYWWTFAIMLAATIPALVLWVYERRARRSPAWHEPADGDVHVPLVAELY